MTPQEAVTDDTRPRWGDFASFDVPPDMAAALRRLLPGIAGQAVAAIKRDVPAYAGALSERRETQIGQAVQLALTGFVDTVTRRPDSPTPLAAVAGGAYALGRGEARAGRSMEALLAAYRVGARVSWREVAGVAVAAGLPAEVIAGFAALVFSYIDDLSAASASGHSDELTNVGITRQRNLERLAHRLLVADPLDAIMLAATRADWTPPTTLTAVLLPQERDRGARLALPAGTLFASDDSADSAEQQLDAETAILLVPDMHGRNRSRLLGLFDATTAVVGPPRPWATVATSVARAASARTLGLDGLVDTEAHLVELVTRADPAALTDLTEQTFAPLQDLKPVARQRLLQTLRSWLLHQGRREAVAAELFVHPQTVRYRMGQLRDLLGDRLDDARWCERAVVALAAATVHEETTR